ncbi:MAG: glycosyltransferase, partial [Chloroflexi bacterium]|nr:glycosyltransferase [Chloroflexota bacterium]
RIATRMGIPIVFTLAPDPHSVIAAEERAGTLDRDTFADFDQAQHAWFRARLVTSLVAVADELVVFPRPGGPAELAQLLGVPLPPARVSVVAEGIDLEQSRVARRVALDGPLPRVIGRLSDRLAAGPSERVGLPLIVSAARLHPVKGLDRLVAAWLLEPELRAAYNLVIVGGSLQDGTPEERRTLAAISAVVTGAGIVGDVPGLSLMGSVSNSDVAHLLAAAGVGSAPHVAPRGIYVCLSAKEEFGLSIVEALAAGLPVVAPNQGGPRTYIADGVTGVLTDTTSVTALATAMLRAIKLWRDPMRGPAAAERLTSMGIDTMAARLVDVYRGSATAQWAVR